VRHETGNKSLNFDSTEDGTDRDEEMFGNLKQYRLASYEIRNR
jgi:hypothetical protein